MNMNEQTTKNPFGSYDQADLNLLSGKLIDRFILMEQYMLQPGNAVGLDEDFFDAIYTLGARYYSNGQYDRSHHLFKMLCTLQPLEVRNFKAWGANYLARQDYSSAVNSYTVAYQLHATDAETSFYLGQCFFMLKENEEATEHFRFSAEMARRFPVKWPQIESWSQQMLKTIENRHPV